MTTAIAKKEKVEAAKIPYGPAAREGRRPVPRGYEELLKRVRKILAAGRARAKTALEREEVRTWWEAAEEVNDDLKKNKGRAKYGEKIVFFLAQNLGVTTRYVYDILQLQRVFPIVKSISQLPLTHCLILAKIEKSRERNLLLRQAVREKWPVAALKKAIRSRKLVLTEGDELEGGAGFKPAPAKEGGFPPLVPRRGKLYTYRLVEFENIRGERYLAVDLGFRIRKVFDLTGVENPKFGDIVEAVRTEKNPAGDRYRFKKSSEKKRALYSYAAQVLHIHDADTYWLIFDLGFSGQYDRKIRLRGIDAKELGDGGEAALEYVKEKLSRVPFVAVSTYWDDKFGRILVDLFYKEGETDPQKVLDEGTYLNQELLDQGLAVRVE